MVHLIGADDRSRAARDYGETPYVFGPKVASTQALATHILSWVETDPNPGLAWVASLLDQLTDEPIAAGVLCTRFLFDLSDAIANEANLGTRFRLLSATVHVLSVLAASDPTNAIWQHVLGIGHERIGSVLKTTGNLDGASAAFKKKQEIIQHLAASDPTNAGWQRDLAVSYEKVGDVLAVQGDAAGALKAYRDSLVIRQALAASDPTNAEWQHNLAASNERVGDVLVAQGDAAGALKAYLDSLVIARRLAAADPTNAEWQRSLSVSHSKVGDVLAAQGTDPHLRVCLT